MSPTPKPFNEARLVTSRLIGYVTHPRIRSVVSPTGLVEALPGQGGVVPNVGLGDRLAGWQSDHLEPGASVGHPDGPTNFALQVMSCVGNAATVIDGPAAGAAGYVFGKHGAVLVMFEPAALRSIAPRDRIVIEACGVGLAVDEAPWLKFHSCSPRFAKAIVSWSDGDKAHIRVRSLLSADAAAAGIGMAVEAYNLDVIPEQSRGGDQLGFGDIVALADHDHSFGRQYRRGWSTVGVLCHGRSVGGGHGFGFVTLLSAPTDRLVLEVDPSFQGTSVFRALFAARGAK